MRVIRLFFLVSISFLLSISLAAQQTATSSPQALLLLQRSLRALDGGQTLTDVTLSGIARRIAGSDDESGPAVLKALATGSTSMVLNLPVGPRSEVHTSPSDAPAGASTGAWSGPDGGSHDIAYHNLISEPAWFFPASVVARGLSTSGYVVTYVGHEARNSITVEHLSLAQQPSGSTKTAAMLQHLAQVEIYLDSTTLLPAALTFNIHPDSNMLLDIPIEIRFSDYRAISGAQVPFHIQKYLNNGLTLDLQFQNVALNTGLTASSFAL
jgi:hypothetical protein